LIRKKEREAILKENNNEANNSNEGIKNGQLNTITEEFTITRGPKPKNMPQ